MSKDGKSKLEEQDIDEGDFDFTEEAEGE